MSVIVPTIMAETLDQLREVVQKIKPFTQRAHFDISDGEFAPTFLLNETQLYWEQGWQVDIHAMVSRPSEHIPQLIALKPDLVIIHVETGEDTVANLTQLKEAGIRAGVALLKATVPSKYAEAIKAADHVMIFSGDLGKFGGTASMMQLEKVRLVKAINPNAEIGWDGGVNVENAYTLSKGGVDVLNTGGAIAKAEDPDAVYAKLVKEINKTGVI
jgi:ribulose-phosphate 3-epimerase